MMKQHIPAARIKEQLDQATQSRWRCDLGTAATQLEAFLRAESALDPADHAALLRELAEIRLLEGSSKTALHLLDNALSLLGPNAVADHPWLWAAISERKAWALFRDGKLNDARKLAESVVEHTNSDAAIRARLHNTVGGIAWQQGRVEDAITDTRRAAELFAEAGDESGSATARTNLGILLFSRGDWSAAAKEFGEAEVLRSRIGWDSDRTRNLVNFGVLEIALGEHGGARRHLEEALRISRERKQEYIAARAEINLAYLELLESHVEEACGHLDHALAASCISDDDRVHAAWMKALVECDRGDHRAGLALASDARKRAKEAHLLDYEADCCRALAVAYNRAGRPEEAERNLLEAVSLAERAGDPYRRALALLDLGALRSARSNIDEAATVFEKLGARHDMKRAATLRLSIEN